MPKLGTTRFNEISWTENEKWRELNKHAGCIYGSPTQIKHENIVGDLIFILEMKNHENSVGAIGMIKNLSYTDKYYRIYADGNYNRYVYKSNYRIKRADLLTHEENIMKTLDILLFKGARHYKRGQGITVLPDYIAKSKYFNFINFLKPYLLINSNTIVDFIYSSQALFFFSYIYI